MTTAELIAFYNEWTGSGKTAEQIAQKIYKETGSSDILKHYNAALNGGDVKDDLAKLAVLLTAYGIAVKNEIEPQLITIDDSLTQQGAAADAKATGDALATKADNLYLQVTSHGSRAAIGFGASAAEGYIAIGNGTIADDNNRIALGEANIQHASGDEQLIVIGNGVYDPLLSTVIRQDAITVDLSGNVWIAGNIKVGGTNSSDSSAEQVVTAGDLASFVPKKRQIEYEKQSAVSGTSYSDVVLHYHNGDGCQAYNYESSSPLAPDSLIKAAGRGNSINLILDTDVYDNLTVHPQYDPDHPSILVGYLYTYNAESLEGSSLQWKKVDDSKEIILVSIGVSNKHVEIISSKSYSTIDWSIVREVNYVTEDELYDAIDAALAGNN